MFQSPHCIVFREQGNIASISFLLCRKNNQKKEFDFLSSSWLIQNINPIFAANFTKNIYNNKINIKT